jgi:NTE family protein
VKLLLGLFFLILIVSFLLLNRKIRPYAVRLDLNILSSTAFSSFYTFCLFLFILCGATPKGIAQDTISKRPKIGVVLSGGGAKGLAHIGVLKVLEQAGVKVDYIGGTSMGAIIGGLYASGYTATQLDSIFNNTDYDAVIQDVIPRSSKNFHERFNDERYALTLPFNKFKLGIPTAFSKGLYNYNMITRLAHNVRHQRDFNKLPIPFVCIATNIETGEEVVLREGFLPQAVLASGAFPSLYSPLIINGKYLIDGGVVNNYPIEEVIKMGADIIIGVDVQDDLKPREALKDATRILVQISNLQMIQRMQDKKNLTTIYIKPNTDDYNVISFDKGKEIIQIGEQTALEQWEKLLELGIGYQKEILKNTKLETDSLKISSVQVSKLDNYTRSYILGKLQFKGGVKITYANLRRGIEKLNATQNFSAINYTLQPDLEPDANKLELTLTENPNKTYLKFGLHYDGLYKSGVLVNLTQKKLVLKNDVLSADLILGDNFRYYLDYYIDNGFYWSFGVKSHINQFNRNVKSDFSDGSLLTEANVNSININYFEFNNQFYMQSFFLQKFVLGLGAEFKHIQIKSETLQNVKPIFEDSNYFSLFSSLKYDSFDNKYFPKKGWYFNGDVQAYLYSSDYTQQFNNFTIFKADAALAQKVFRKTTLKLQTEGGFAVGEETVPFLNFVLGGYGFYPVSNFKPFYGYDFVSLAGNSYVKALFQLDYEFYKKNHLNFFANFANIGQNIFDTNQWYKKPAYSGYGLGYGLETVLGPVEIKHSWSPETKDHHTWFAVGFWF